MSMLFICLRLLRSAKCIHCFWALSFVLILYVKVFYRYHATSACSAVQNVSIFMRWGIKSLSSWLLGYRIPILDTSIEHTNSNLAFIPSQVHILPSLAQVLSLFHHSLLCYFDVSSGSSDRALNSRAASLHALVNLPTQPDLHPASVLHYSPYRYAIIVSSLFLKSVFFLFFKMENICLASELLTHLASLFILSHLLLDSS